MKRSQQMKKSENKLSNTAVKMDNALIELLNTRDFEAVTVKELCEKAGVNRSTFYLHYENLGELLEESILHLLSQFNAAFAPENRLFITRLRDCPLDELYLVTPEYLIPYLGWVSEHQKLLGTIFRNAKLFKLDNIYTRVFNDIISPIFDRFGIPEQDRHYKAVYYINGIFALVGEWLKNGCRDSFERMAVLIQDCVMSGANIEKHFSQRFIEEFGG